MLLLVSVHVPLMTKDDYESSRFSSGRSYGSNRGYREHEFEGDGGRRERSKSWSREPSGSRDPFARRWEPSNSRGRGDDRFRESAGVTRGQRQRSRSLSFAADNDDRNQWRCDTVCFLFFGLCISCIGARPQINFEFLKFPDARLVSCKLACSVTCGILVIRWNAKAVNHLQERNEKQVGGVVHVMVHALEGSR